MARVAAANGPPACSGFAFGAAAIVLLPVFWIYRLRKAGPGAPEVLPLPVTSRAGESA